MDFSSQLRIILLIAGGVAMLCIYLLGKRHGRVAERNEQLSLRSGSPSVQDFGPVSDMDEDELDTPAYLRRSQQEARRDEPLPMVNLPAGALVDYEDERPLLSADDPDDSFEQSLTPWGGDDDVEAINSTDEQNARSFSVGSHVERVIKSPLQQRMDSNGGRSVVRPSVVEASAEFAESAFAEHTVDESISTHAVEPNWQDVIIADTTSSSVHDEFVRDEAFHDEFVHDESLNEAVARDELVNDVPVHDVPVITNTQSVGAVGATGSDVEPPTVPNITQHTAVPVVEQSVLVKPSAEKTADLQSATVAPTPTPAPSATASVAAPRLDAPPKTLPHKRKIVALRLSMPVRVSGEQLLSLLQRENLHHGRFDIFHRLHEDVSVFSVASMVEPGSFNLSTMRDQQFPGVTFFMLLPGPLDGLVAWDQMYSCAQRLAHATQGVLQDERGQRMTSMAADRLREDVLDFQHLLGSVNV